MKLNTLYRTWILSLVIGLILSAFSASASQAWERGRDWGHGRWIHSRHDGRLGWWWVSESGWHYYPRPIVIGEPVMAPPAAVIIAPPVPRIVIR